MDENIRMRDVPLEEVKVPEVTPPPAHLQTRLYFRTFDEKVVEKSALLYPPNPYAS